MMTILDIKNTATEIAVRLKTAGWDFDYDHPIRTDEYKAFDTQALARAEFMVGRALPQFYRDFVIEIGMINFGGFATPGTAAAKWLPSQGENDRLAALAPIATLPLPAVLNEIKQQVEEVYEPMGVPVIQDPFDAVELSGGPPLCLLCQDDDPLRLFADVDESAPMRSTLPEYLEHALQNGGFFGATIEPGEQAQFFAMLTDGIL